jgi:hypothetical protein
MYFSIFSVFMIFDWIMIGQQSFMSEIILVIRVMKMSVSCWFETPASCKHSEVALISDGPDVAYSTMAPIYDVILRGQARSREADE